MSRAQKQKEETISLKKLIALERRGIEKTLKANKSTLGYAKLSKYFDEQILSKNYQNRIHSIRDRFNIPKKGFRRLKRKELNPKNRFYIPTKWLETNEADDLVPIQNEIKEICEGWFLHYMDWKEVFLNYIFFNMVLLPEDADALNLCVVHDHPETSEEPDEIDTWTESDNMAFPIALRISPYASERVILDYVKKMYKIKISPIQKRYVDPDSRVGKVRQKKEVITKRNALIWKLHENKGMSAEDIMSYLLGSDLRESAPDASEIKLILRREEKRRR